MTWVSFTVSVILRGLGWERVPGSWEEKEERAKAM